MKTRGPDLQWILLSMDSLATVVTDDSAIVYVWYDNEFGYSNQVIRVVEGLSNARPVVLPKRVSPSEL